jgi:hypothetical protein
MRDYSIRAEKLVRYAGVYSPFVVYPFGRMCDSELIGHVFKSTNQPHLTTFLSWRIYLIAHTPKNRRLEFICQDFQSPKLIRFRTHPQNAPILPLVCVNIRSFSKSLFFSMFCLFQKPHTRYRKRTCTPYSMCYQLLQCRTPRDGFLRIKDIRLKLAICAGSILVHLTILS